MRGDCFHCIVAKGEQQDKGWKTGIYDMAACELTVVGCTDRHSMVAARSL